MHRDQEVAPTEIETSPESVVLMWQSQARVSQSSTLGTRELQSLLTRPQHVAANLSPDQSPCLELPDKAWDEPRLLSECPLCRKPLRFNPFIVDNRGRW